MRARPGLRIAGAWDPFECAVRALLGQQVSVRRPHAGGAPGRAHGERSPAAPTASRTCFRRRTRSRAPDSATLGALARAVAGGALDLTGPSDEAVTGLLRVALGVDAAEEVALRALGEPDAFPAGDPILRRAAGCATARELSARAEAWRPWRGYAAIHLYAAARR